MRQNFYYENNFLKGDYTPFDKFLNSVYDDQFTKMDHIRSIVDDERRFSYFLKTFLEKLGYDINLYEPYFHGFGASAIDYIVSRNNKVYVMKFIYEGNNFSTFVQMLDGYKMIADAGLKQFVAPIRLSLFNHNGGNFEYETLKGEHVRMTISYGIIIHDYVGETLDSIIRSSDNPNLNSVCEQLEKIEVFFLNQGLIHETLHESNITMNDGRVYFHSLEGVKHLKQNGFPTLDNLIKRLDTNM